MPNATLILISLLALGFTLATWLQPWHTSWEGHRRRDQGVLALFLGDGRRLFGEYFFRKADVYFHSGVYPSMFDQAAAYEENHMALATSAPADDHKSEPEAEDDHDHDHDHDHEDGDDHDHEHEGEHAELPPRNDAPIDWLDRFSRSFYPTRHVHMEEGRAREILPWIRISAELDPQNVATYTTAAFWLRRQMGKPDEAEKFLREGLRANPGNPEILFELGRLFDEDRGDADRARNLYELSLRQWEARPESEKEDITLFRQVVAHLAWLEERQDRLPQAIGYWQRLAFRLEDPTAIQQRIAELQSRLNPPAPAAEP